MNSAGSLLSGDPFTTWNVVLFLLIIIGQLWVTRGEIGRLFRRKVAYRKARNPLAVVGITIGIELVAWILFWRWVGVIK